MEVKLTGGQTSKVVSGGINPKELTPETYVYYCRLYLIERIHEIVPVGSATTYGDITRIINTIDPILFRNLNLETNRILLLNEIYSLFMSITCEEISREFLYEKTVHLSKYDPSLNGDD